MKDYMLSLVVPVFNEEEVLPASFARMQSVLQKMGCAYEIIYVNDGSRDDTLSVLRELCARDESVKVLSFSRNFGHQLAVTAGMDAAKGDCVVIIDVDLQDPPELLPRMVELWQQGNDIVYGKRLKREGESAFKKFTAFVYYRLLSALTPIQIPLDTGDFRLIDKRVNATVSGMRENNRFLRGMSAWAGYKSVPLEYKRDERLAGNTKYSLKMMLKLALDGIIGFSATPLMLPLFFGIGLGALSGAGLLAAFITFLCGVKVAAWVWAYIGLMLVLAVVLFSMGMLGSYISRVYDDVKGRPLYIIDETLTNATITSENISGGNKND